MRAVAGNIEHETRRAWADYAERLRGLDGAEYDRAEPQAWEQLQDALRDLGVESTTVDDASV
jgi:hypothetical protein